MATPACPCLVAPWLHHAGSKGGLGTGEAMAALAGGMGGLWSDSARAAPDLPAPANAMATLDKDGMALSLSVAAPCCTACSPPLYARPPAHRWPLNSTPHATARTPLPVHLRPTRCRPLTAAPRVAAGEAWQEKEGVAGEGSSGGDREGRRGG